MAKYIKTEEGYVLKEEIVPETEYDNKPTADSDKLLNSGAIYKALGNKSELSFLGALPPLGSGLTYANHIPTWYTITLALGGKHQLFFETTPKSGSSNIVTSGGIYNSLVEIKNLIPTESSYPYTTTSDNRTTFKNNISCLKQNKELTHIFNMVKWQKSGPLDAPLDIDEYLTRFEIFEGTFNGVFYSNLKPQTRHSLNNEYIVIGNLAIAWDEWEDSGEDFAIYKKNGEWLYRFRNVDEGEEDGYDISLYGVSSLTTELIDLPVAIAENRAEIELLKKEVNLLTQKIQELET